MPHRIAAAALAALVSGCAADIRDIGRPPQLTPVGSGLAPVAINPAHAPAHRPAYAGPNSLWQDAGGDLFRDPRAMKPGDVVTVKILIKDRASLDNSSNRKRESTRDIGLSMDYDLAASGFTPNMKASGSGGLNSAIDSNTETKGSGGVSRSETIDLLIAAVVTGVLPNGNLLISGTQEVRVNYEVRDLSVAGVVRPRDISPDNTISYDKIAEARISYGGRGRAMEVLQPGLGHQITDLLMPF
ncbi:MAG: flagellar basal body L-ring protein FlgH [Hyphomicrobiales bacterium]|nr:flagellar basal body L-ring protein FlgH [Hyphomicrobiales bacterium]